MRIALDGTPLLGRRTGIGRYAHHLVAELPAALRRAGIEGDVVVTTWTARGGHVVDLPDGVRQVGLPVPARVVRAAWSRWDVPPVELLAGRCDVFHGTNFVSPPTARAREVVTVHDLTYELHRETVSPDSLAYRRLVRRALVRGAHVVTPSRTVAQDVRAFYGLEDDRVSVTALGVDEEWFAAEPAVARDAAVALPERYLLFVGSIDPRKNLRRLLDAHARLRERRADTPDLVLAGPAGRETGLSGIPHVHLTGWLEDDALRRVVAGAAALLLPSLDEGFGLPALEALACGRPVVVSDIPTLREVTGGHAVVCDPHDTDAVADALDTVLDVPDGLAERAVRTTHARRFTWAACADATVAAYRGTTTPRA